MPVRRMPTWTLIRMPSSRASAQSCCAVSGVTFPTARAAIASVSSWSSEEKYCLRMRRMSSGWSRSLYAHQLLSPGMPCA